MPKEPSAREALFCEYYKILRSPREAAARAGYPFPEKAGIRLLSKERIKRELRPSNDAVEGLRRLAFGSVADAVRLCRGEIPDKELEKLDLFMVSELKFPKAGGVEVKFFDRIKPLISGLAAVSETLLKIYDCIGVNFERLGNPRFAVISRAEDCSDGDSRAREMAQAWSEAMGDKHSVRDFVAVGDVEIKVIGAENAIPDITVPVRALLEQIIAKTGLPPFLLGLSWSSTEKMSQQQADILTSELEYYRELVNPLIMRVCRAFLYGIGCFEDPEIVWSNISLQDEKELAEARYYNARAERLERGEGE